MSLATEIYARLSILCDGRVYPGKTPEKPVFPLIIYQRIGGEAYEYTDQAMPQHDNARVQVDVWSKSVTEADAIARQVREMMLSHDWPAQTFGAPVDSVDGDLHGCRQDFGVWYAP